MLLPSSPGSVGGVGRLFVVSFGLLKRELSSGASFLLARRGQAGSVGYFGDISRPARGLWTLQVWKRRMTDWSAGITGITCSG
jgi:hypothetical protein